MFNLGTGKGTSVKEIIEKVREITGHPIPTGEISRRAGDPPELVASAEKIKRVLGWEAQYGIQDILESAWSWHPKNFYNAEPSTDHAIQDS